MKPGLKLRWIKMTHKTEVYRKLLFIHWSKAMQKNYPLLHIWMAVNVHFSKFCLSTYIHIHKSIWISIYYLIKPDWQKMKVGQKGKCNDRRNSVYPLHKILGESNFGPVDLDQKKQFSADVPRRHYFWLFIEFIKWNKLL